MINASRNDIDVLTCSRSRRLKQYRRLQSCEKCPGAAFWATGKFRTTWTEILAPDSFQYDGRKQRSVSSIQAKKITSQSDGTIDVRELARLRCDCLWKIHWTRWNNTSDEITLRIHWLTPWMSTTAGPWILRNLWCLLWKRKVSRASGMASRATTSTTRERLRRMSSLLWCANMEGIENATLAPDSLHNNMQVYLPFYSDHITANTKPW